MEVFREDGGAALVRLEHDDVRGLLGAFALSMAAYGVLQNFMTPAQKSWALPSIVFISRLGALLAEGEEFDETPGQPAVQAAEADAAEP